MRSTTSAMRTPLWTRRKRPVWMEIPKRPKRTPRLPSKSVDFAVFDGFEEVGERRRGVFEQFRAAFFGTLARVADDAVVGKGRRIEREVHPRDPLAPALARTLLCFRDPVVTDEVGLCRPQHRGFDGSAMTHVRRVDGVEPRERYCIGRIVPGNRFGDLAERADVAAVTVDQNYPFEAVRREAIDGFADVLAEGIGRDPKRSRESAVFFGDPDGDRGCEYDRTVTSVFIGRRAGFGDCPCGETVGAERGVWAVLFGASDGENGEIGFRLRHVGPRRLGQVHTSMIVANGLSRHNRFGHALRAIRTMANTDDETRQQGVEFGEFGEKMRSLDYPIDNDELLAEYGDAELELPSGTETLDEILAPLQDDEQTY